MDETTRLNDRQRFIDKHKHELAGLILDGATFNRTGGELAIWCRNIMHRCDNQLARIFDDVFPPPARVQKPLTDAEKAALAAQQKRPPTGGK